LRIALTAVVLASFAPLALAAPGGGIPHPQPIPPVSSFLFVILSIFGL
jgi:hypothetical protein